MLAKSVKNEVAIVTKLFLNTSSRDRCTIFILTIKLQLSCGLF